MTCNSTDQAEYGKKTLARNRRRAARIYDIQARRLASDILHGRRAKRPNKAQRILREARTLLKSAREMAELCAGANGPVSGNPECWRGAPSTHAPAKSMGGAASSSALKPANLRM